MSRPRLDIAADIPLDLAYADEALTRYGRWAADRESRRRCFDDSMWHVTHDPLSLDEIGGFVRVQVKWRQMKRVDGMP